MEYDGLSLVATAVALATGFFLLFWYGKKGTGMSTGSGSRKGPANSRLLSEAEAVKSVKPEVRPQDEHRSSGTCSKFASKPGPPQNQKKSEDEVVEVPAFAAACLSESSDRHTDGISSDTTAPVNQTVAQSTAHADPNVDLPKPVLRRFHFAKPGVLPPLPHGSNVEVWDVCSPEDASSLLASCPSSSTVCVGFFKKFVEGMNAQKSALYELAAAQPVSFIFSAVDIQDAKEVAAWAGVKDPLVRLLDPTGMVVADFQPAQVKKGLLHQKVLTMAAEFVKTADSKLEALVRRFPGSLCNQMMTIPCPKTGLDKMLQHGLEALQGMGDSSAAEATFQSLCKSCEVSLKSRVRDVATFSRILREAPSSGLVPLLDLARRLAEQNLLGGSDPGAAEAFEMLVDACLQRSFDADVDEPAHWMLAMHLLVNSSARSNLQEVILPIVGQVVRCDSWAKLWKISGSAYARTHEAAIALLLNSSIALRSVSCRVEHKDILQGAVTALRHMPENECINVAVGNLLAAGGTSEDAKHALQAQPLPTLRKLAAALYHGELDGPEGCAFPAVWQPEPQHGQRDETGSPQEHDRRPPRAPIPARHRGRRGGG